ncbi:MAG: response regulator transcription factor [Pseudomonadota bacterium]
MSERTIRVLVVEDDTGIGRMLERGLAAKGYRVDWVRDLRSAIVAAREVAHDIIVLDRMLPDGDGADLCRALRRFGSEAPVCMLTARETLDDKLEGFDAGADDYRTKHFEYDELIARLAALTRRIPAAAIRPVLVPEDKALQVGRRRVQFTDREWSLFSMLHAQVGTPVTRAALLAAGWGDAGVADNTLDVYVGYLRRKLASAEVSLRIETVRGVGFVLKQ